MAAHTPTTPLLPSPPPQVRTPHTQRKRGSSFLAHCLQSHHMTATPGTHNNSSSHGAAHGSNDSDGDSSCSGGDAAATTTAAAAGGASFRRSPTLSRTDEFLIPGKAAALRDCLTVVLDLDETLVYARSGPLYVRPGCEALMAFLAAHCETVVWTSSMHHYADAVVAQIDSAAAIHHVVYRHPRWCKTSSSTKDLRLLGRDLDKTIIIENTPDCIVGYEANGVLVGDYDGGELEDTTLTNLLELLTDLVEQHRQHGVTVPAYIAASARVQWRELPSDTGAFVGCYCLHTPELDPPLTASVALHTSSHHHRHLHDHDQQQLQLQLPPTMTQQHYHCQNCALRHYHHQQQQLLLTLCQDDGSDATTATVAAGDRDDVATAAATAHDKTTCGCARVRHATPVAASSSSSLSAKRHRLSRTRVGKGECMWACRRPQPLKKVLIC